MTYSAGGKIQATDYNNFVVTGTPNLNNIWSVGSGDSGYGQSALATVSTGNKVFATNWADLVNSIASAAAHQGTSISSITPTPATGVKISAFVPTLSNNLSAVNAGRLNASVQGGSTVPTGGTATNSTPWSDTLTITHTVTFASDNAVRYYFNAGGQIQLTYASTGGSDPVDAYLSELCANMGTITLSSPTSGTVSIAGTNFSGVSQSGSTGGTSSLNSNNGFYTLYATQNTPFTLNTQQDGPGTYSSSFIRLSARYNGGGVIQFITLIDIIDSTPGFSVTGTTTATLTLKPPSTSFLANTWGDPTVGNTVTPV